MKRFLSLIFVAALVLAFAATSFAYTLTVSSYNPSSGVAITVSPNDTQGRNNGTTQFSRSYNTGTIVTLTAPAGLTGKKFQKWRKGSTDYTTTPMTIVTMSASTTMTAYYVNDTTAPITTADPVGGTYADTVTVSLTANEAGTTYYCTGSGCTPTTVYTMPLTFTTATTLRYYTKDVANNSESVKTQTYSFTYPHASLTWTGYGMCVSCHTDKALEVKASAHYTWEGPALYMVNGAPIQGKLKTSVNSYCGNIIGNWGCSACHVGVGKRPDDATLTEQQHLENIDCLMCHQKEYKRKKDATTGLMVPDTANMTITMDQAVQTVHKPVRKNCIQCHAKGGGGDNFKRGDLAVAHGTTADRNFDVHMASTTTGNLVCQKCHAVQQHKIAGRGSDLRQTDLDVKPTCSTATCHSAKTTSTGHTTKEINFHVNRVACQSCHIGVYARKASDTAATEATETRRDWSVPEWSTANNRWEPTVTMANDLKPEYKFWNGTSWGYSIKDPASIDPATGRYPTSRPMGTINDSNPISKIFPFKYKTTYRPYASNLGILIPINTKIYFSTAGSVPTGVDDSIKSSLTLMGYSSTEPYTWVDDDTYQLITHEVMPKASVRSCTQCHQASDSCRSCHSAMPTQMNLKEMGYVLKAPSTSICNQCHEYKNPSQHCLKEIHNEHAEAQNRDCSWCHTFSRPERTGSSYPH